MKQGISNALAIGAILLSLCAVGIVSRGTSAPNAHTETAFQRIMRTGTIRCGYVIWQPYMSYDAQTGQMSGVAYDYTMALAQELGLKVEWAEETGWGSYSEGLNTGRFDVMFAPPWSSGFRARSSLLTKAAIGSALYAVGRADDTRFPTVESLNNNDVTIAVIDGDATQSVRQMKFPLAKELGLSPITDNATMILNVTGKKADVAFYDANNIEMYNAHAKDKIKTMAGGKPIRIFDCVYAVKIGETDLKNALDAAITALTRSGITQQIVNKYPGISMPMAD